MEEASRHVSEHITSISALLQREDTALDRRDALLAVVRAIARVSASRMRIREDAALIRSLVATLSLGVDSDVSDTATTRWSCVDSAAGALWLVSACEVDGLYRALDHGALHEAIRVLLRALGPASPPIPGSLAGDTLVPRAMPPGCWSAVARLSGLAEALVADRQTWHPLAPAPAPAAPIETGSAAAAMGLRARGDDETGGLRSSGGGGVRFRAGHRSGGHSSTQQGLGAAAASWRSQAPPADREQLAALTDALTAELSAGVLCEDGQQCLAALRRVLDRWP